MKICKICKKEIKDITPHKCIERLTKINSETPVASKDFYMEDGLCVFTKEFHLKRGYCCDSACRHCPWRD